ncbi:response regulator [Leptospira ognonensis]|uniref:Response regulator n=2 Tax=Leptospira ognonensis TaxID=2484945 RepID=A0A4R9JWY0_9LEPT|nr:response regulator [Leptospira ognonensis]
MKSLISKMRRPPGPVLIVEDREDNQMLLAGICESIHVPFQLAENGKVALELLSLNEVSVFLVDLMMPVMDGKSFIRELKKLKSDAVILVQTAIDGTDEIIEIMKMGVYDYLVKPLNVDLVKTTLLKALEYRYLIDIEKVLLRDESKELREQLEWLNYKETARKSSQSSTEVTAIYNLKTTLSQGSGFGAMTTLIDTIVQTSTRNENGTVTIDGEFFQVLEENNNHTKSMLRGLASAVEILESKVELTKTFSGEIVSRIEKVASHLASAAATKSITINLPMIKSEVKLLVNLELLSLCFKELLLNAIKYANASTAIDCFITLTDGYFCISFKNQLPNDIYSDISEDSQKSLVLPFFRMHPPVEALHKEEPFSLGLGLTMVDFIANKHHGMFFIRKAKDHTSKDVGFCTIAELFLPIQI